MTEIGLVESNLRACFRSLAGGREHAEIRRLGGCDIASLGVRFQMFNAAFLAEPVLDAAGLDRRIAEASVLFQARGTEWAFWVCDGMLPGEAQRRARRMFSKMRMAFASEMPGMIAPRLAAPARALPQCDVQPADSAQRLSHFRQIGAECFRVPSDWFQEVFDEDTPQRAPFRGWVAYAAGRPVATAATVVAGGSLGIYNVATLPEYRSHGFAEALMRESIAREMAQCGELPVVLQSTADGHPLYERMGFRTVTTFRVWVS